MLRLMPTPPKGLEVDIDFGFWHGRTCRFFHRIGRYDQGRTDQDPKTPDWSQCRSLFADTSFLLRGFFPFPLFRNNGHVRAEDHAILALGTRVLVNHFWGENLSDSKYRTCLKTRLGQTNVQMPQPLTLLHVSLNMEIPSNATSSF